MLGSPGLLFQRVRAKELTIAGWIARLGERLLERIAYIGGLAMLFGDTIMALVTTGVRRRHAVSQMSRIGVNSLPIVSLISIFIGIVLAFQSAYQMRQVSLELYIPGLVSLSMTREIGPVLTALAVAGRVGAAITAEIGTMKVTEQLDAMRSLATDPVAYLVVPRFWALVTMLPLLTIYADGIGMVGGYLVGTGSLGLSSSLYLEMNFQALLVRDVLTGLMKSVVFAVIICTVASHEGFRASGGAEGVGRATTLSVVTSFIMVIAADCLFTALFYFAS